MPTLVRLYVKTAFVHLLLALLLWAWKGLDYPYRPAFLHLFFVGWLLFLIFGVAHWMFPRYSKEQVRGPEGPVALAYGFLLGGLWGRVISEPLFLSGYTREWVRLILLGSAWLQWLGGLAFTLMIWKRIRKVGR